MQRAVTFGSRAVDPSNFEVVRKPAAFFSCWAVSRRALELLGSQLRRSGAVGQRAVPSGSSGAVGFGAASCGAFGQRAGRTTCASARLMAGGSSQALSSELSGFENVRQPAEVLELLGSQSSGFRVVRQRAVAFGSRAVELLC